MDAAKTAALKIQVYWRERFVVMDAEKLRTESPLLAGDGMISLVEAADAIGISPRALAGELLNDRAHAYAHVHGLPCWKVPDLSDIERDHDGSFILNDVEDKGVRCVHSGIVRFIDSRATLGQFVAGANSREAVFRDGRLAAIFLDHEQEVTLSECITSKAAVAQIRARLAASAPPSAIRLMPAAVTVSEPVPLIYDPVQAKHGKKRFSELFELYKRDRDWGPDQTRRMTTEAGLFIELMGDPELGEIEKETVLEFARRLALLPSDIYQSKRRYGVTSLDELIATATREKLACKNETTIKGHVGRLSEVLGYGVKAGMMRFNPASDYKRGRSGNGGQRAQDERQVFTPDELSLIFSQDWFRDGSGTLNRSGWTHWRPHYYWLPLMGLLTGGRINELSQLHLDDIRQSETGVWYLDFNLDGSDKMDEPDKSLKTVNAVRVVPLHGDLVRLGLPEYVGALRKAGYTRLFPELKRDPVKGYGKPAGSWFNERFLGSKLGIERNGMKTFHSLRHCFLTAAERLGLPERVLAQLAGHERGSTQSMTRYAKDRNADELATNIAGLQFPQLSAISPIKIASALTAIRCAERQKVSAARRNTVAPTAPKPRTPPPNEM
ncbi:site-specific integrase [Paraburkholderia dipogonis]